MSSGSSSRVVAWLQLIRLPNLATVPGDPIAGFFLAGGAGLDVSLSRAAAVAGVSLCLYAVGMLLNDLVDVEEDRRDRPSRPLARGAVPCSRVRAVIIALLIAAAGMSLVMGPWAFGIACGLAGAVFAYNLWAKHIAGIGVIVMGLCRGLSVLVGAACAVGLNMAPGIVFVGAGCVTAYIISVSVVARLEMEPERLPMLRWLPNTVCVLIATLLRSFRFLVDPFLVPLIVGLFGVLLIVTLSAGIRIGLAGGDAMDSVPRQIGSLIRATIFLQAALILFGGSSTIHLATAAAVAALWIPGKILGRWLYAS